MILASYDEILNTFDRLIELLQDSGVEASTIVMIEDAKDMLIEACDDEYDEIE